LIVDGRFPIYRLSSAAINDKSEFHTEVCIMKVVPISDPNQELLFGPLSPEDLQTAKDLARAAFTADDLQLYTEPLEGIPLEDVIKELEENQKKAEQQKTP
jgi:hypothetical protein